MKMISLRIVSSAIAVSALISGCQSGLYKVTTSEDDKSVDNSIRYYEVAKGKGSFAADFMKDGGSSPDGILYDEERMPVEIVEGRNEKFPDKPGWSGVLWLFTVGIWPMCHSEYMTQDITVKSPIGEKTGSYRVDAKWWAGWFPIVIGYPSSADERSAEASLPNRRLEGVGRDRLVKSLVGEFSYNDYVTFAKKENANRKIELDRIAASKRKIDELVSKNQYDDAIALCDTDSKSRTGSLENDKETWHELKKSVVDKKEDYRVANKKADLEKKFAESKFEDVVTACGEENNGEERHSSIWADLKSKAENAISERDRKIELARIEIRKTSIAKLLKEKKYAEVIAECNKETGANAGSRHEDSAIWSGFQKQAQVEKDKIDRAVEEKRIAAKFERVNKLLSEKKYADVVALCEEERGQNAGSRPEDLMQWKSIRAKALADDLLSKIDERSKNGFCLKGFYLGMSVEEVDILLNYYFPSMSHSHNGSHVDIAGQVMHFCETASGRVTRMNFNKKMLEKWFEYDVQSDEEWAIKFSKDHNIEFRSNHVRDSKSKGNASISVSQTCYTHKNARQKIRVTYFGEKDVSDYNKDPQEIENEAMAKIMSFGNDMAYRDIAYQIGHKAGYAAQCVKIVRAWLKDEYDNGKGAAEGTLRVESLSE